MELESSDGTRAAALWLDARFGHLQLFTGEALPEPERRRRSLVVEPMTCAPNAFRSGEGLIVLAPGQSLTCTWGIVPGRRSS